MREPSIGPLMKIPVILIGYKYQNIYMSPKYVNDSSVPTIGHRTQHPLTQMILPCMSLGVSLTIIVITCFEVVGDSFELWLLTSEIFSLYRLRLNTLYSLHIVLLLVMIHIYMMISLTVSLKTFLFSVDLQSLTAQCHCLCINLRLHTDKPHLQKEGVKTKRDIHMVYRVHL